MPLLDDAESWLTGFLRTTQARSVTYTRGGVSRAVPAIAADQPVRVDQPAPPQARIEWKERWYQIAVEDFAATGWGEPQVGDSITETLAGVSRTFRVARPSDEPHWRWIDEARTAFQVRTMP